MEKSCDTCNNQFQCNMYGVLCSDGSKWQPEYDELKRENAKLTQVLERAIKCIDCLRCPLTDSDTNSCSIDSGVTCHEALLEHFKEAAQ